MLLWNFNGDNICSSNSMIRVDAKVRALKPHERIHASVLQRGSSSADGSPIYASEIDFARSGNEVPIVVMYAQYSRTPHKTIWFWSTVGCRDILAAELLRTRRFMSERRRVLFQRAALRLNGNVDETVYRREYLSNKKNVNGRKLRNDQVIHLKALRLNCSP